MIAGNSRLLEAWRSQVSQLRMLLTLSGSEDYDMRNIVKGHQQILDAIREQDLETAQSYLERHIGMSRDRLLKRMQEKRD